MVHLCVFVFMRRRAVVRRLTWVISWTGWGLSHSRWSGSQWCIAWLLRKALSTTPDVPSAALRPSLASGSGPVEQSVRCVCVCVQGRIKTQFGLMLQQCRRIGSAKGWGQPVVTPSSRHFPFPYPPFPSFLPLPSPSFPLEVGPLKSS